MANREMAETAMKVCEKYNQLFADVGIDLGGVYYEAKKALYAIKLNEDYGINNITRDMVVSAEPNVYVKIEENMYIASMGEKYRRTISWSTNGQQPKDEVMLVLTFPTGAYIFGDGYPKDLFSKMWDEFKTYDFKYVDNMNSNMYFPLEKSAPIANAFLGILDKYYKVYRAEANARRAEALRNELKKLEAADD